MDSVVNLAVEKIGELMLQDAMLLRGVKDQVESLQHDLTMMNNSLIDMESVDDEQIRRIAYDAEDVIESYILEVSNPAQNKNHLAEIKSNQVGAKIDVIKTMIATTMESLRIHRDRGVNGLKKVIGDEDENIGAMEALGKEMSRKRKGLPLENVALRVRVAEDGNLEEMLSLSYNDLSRELKPCFLYLGLFPEDREIPIGMLIRMWIAEGFISSNKLQEGETMEDLAGKYLDELIGRCMVPVASRNYEGKAKTIEIYDLMRDLCINKAKELDFLETFSAGSSSSDTRTTKPRRTALHSYNILFRPFSTNNRHLRSLFLFARPNVGEINHDSPNYAKLSDSRPIFDNFKLLRVLNLVAIDTSNGTLPKEIGSLILLRYLGLRVTRITQLPSSIGNLRNLLTLDYRSSTILVDGLIHKTPPNVLWQIQGLRHVYLPSNTSMKEMRFDTLQQLQTLWVGGGRWMLDQLPKLSKNLQKLHIQGIENNDQLEVAFRCPSIVSDRLRSLYLDWSDDSPSGEDDDEDEDEGRTILRSFEHMVNSRHIRKLTLVGRIDDRLGNLRFPYGTKKLKLENSKLKEEATLEALGELQNLKYLHLSVFSYMDTDWTCIEGMFPQLKELILSSLRYLEEWVIEKGAMCKLEKLIINACSELERIPEGLKFITTLQELKMNAMPTEFCDKLTEDAHIIQHIPVIKVDGITWLQQ